eukprot:1168056-Rhodomonas_salina.4
MLMRSCASWHTKEPPKTPLSPPNHSQQRTTTQLHNTNARKQEPLSQHRLRASRCGTLAGTAGKGVHGSDVCNEHIGDVRRLSAQLAVEVKPASGRVPSQPQTTSPMC